jgi:hypothetical protein
MRGRYVNSKTKIYVVKLSFQNVGFEVSTAATLKNAVFWGVAP